MPTYKVLSDEVLEDWRARLDELAMGLIKNPTKSGVEMFLVELYEYLVVTIGYREKYFGKPAENVKISLSDIKKVVNSPEMSSNFRFLKDSADNIRHAYYSNSALKDFRELTQRRGMEDIWVNFLSDGSYAQKLLLDKEKMLGLYREIFEPGDLYNDCRVAVKNCLSVNPDTRRSDYSVSGAIAYLIDRFRCSKLFAMSVVLDEIKDHDVV